MFVIIRNKGIEKIVLDGIRGFRTEMFKYSYYTGEYRNHPRIKREEDGWHAESFIGRCEFEGKSHVLCFNTYDIFIGDYGREYNRFNRLGKINL